MSPSPSDDARLAPDPDRLIRRHLDLPARLARRYRGPRLSDDDLAGEANLALVEAARAYDVAEHPELSFAAFAERHIRRRLREALERAPLVRMPRALERRALRGDAAHAPRPHAVAVEDLGLMPGDLDRTEATEELLRDCTAAERELVDLMVAGYRLPEAGRRLGVSLGEARSLFRGAYRAIEAAFERRGFDLPPALAPAN